MSSLTNIVFVISCVHLLQLCASKALKKVPCRYDDEDCLTRATRAIYPIIVAGRPGQVEASDPLNRDVIDLDLPDLSYTLYNATLYGLQKCTVEDVIVNAKKSFFDYQIWCPKLHIKSDYEIKGNLKGYSIEGLGTSNLFYTNFEILLKGYYGRHTDEAGDLHTNIENFKLDLSTEEIKPEFTGISFCNQDGSPDPEEKNLKNLEEIIRKPMFYSFMRKYIKNLNEFLKIVPVKDIHYHIVEDCA